MASAGTTLLRHQLDRLAKLAAFHTRQHLLLLWVSSLHFSCLRHDIMSNKLMIVLLKVLQSKVVGRVTERIKLNRGQCILHTALHLIGTGLVHTERISLDLHVVSGCLLITF